MGKFKRFGLLGLVTVIVTAFIIMPLCNSGNIANAASKKKLKIGFSNIARFSLAFIAGEEYLRRLSEENGWKYRAAIAEGDAAQQAQDIEDFIAQGVDIVIAMAIDAKAITSSVQSAHAAGVPIFGYMRPQDPDAVDKFDFFSGQDAEAQAYDTAVELKKIMDKDGVKAKDVRVLHIIGDLADQNALDRKRGFEKACKEYGWTIAAEVVAHGWNLDDALTGSTNALEADSTINAALIASDYLFPGLKTALQNQGKLKKRGEKGHVYVGSQDIFPVGVDAIRDGYIDASGFFDMGGMAKVTIEQIKMMLNKETVDQTTTPKRYNVLRGAVITIDNVETTPFMWGIEFHPDNQKKSN